MAKTNELAKPRSISKGGQRRDIYYNENGDVFGDNKGSERNFSATTEVSNDVDRARAETLRYYFDDEWFDDPNYLKVYNSHKSMVKNIRNSGGSNPPIRCTECRRPFQVEVNSGGNKVYLDDELFMNMPLVDGICHGCA
jgi:hypothetical protein